MNSVVLNAMPAQPDTGPHLSGGAVLIMAAVLLFVALRLLGQALRPLRDVLRALIAAGAMVLLVAVAFALILLSLIIPR